MASTVQEGTLHGVYGIEGHPAWRLRYRRASCMASTVQDGTLHGLYATGGHTAWPLRYRRTSCMASTVQEGTLHGPYATGGHAVWPLRYGRAQRRQKGNTVSNEPVRCGLKYHGTWTRERQRLYK
jgi:hypothetical protein